MELPGFNKEQQRLLSILVRYQINQLKTAELYKFPRYCEQDILSLIRLFRLAIILNKSRQATEPISQITLKFDRTLTQWKLQFNDNYLANNPLIKMN